MMMATVIKQKTFWRLKVIAAHRCLHALVVLASTHQLGVLLQTPHGLNLRVLFLALFFCETHSLRSETKDLLGGPLLG